MKLNINCEIMAELARLKWLDVVTYREGVLEIEENPDPFFDSLGCWDSEKDQIVVDPNRCEERPGLPFPKVDVIEAVKIHFCAKAVIHRGVHPETGLRHTRWDEGLFEAEYYPMKPNHPSYNFLIREQELFTQILTRLYLEKFPNPSVLRVFQFLSTGHGDLYSLNYETPKMRGIGSVPAHLRRDWEKWIISSECASAQAYFQMALYALTRGGKFDKSPIELESDRFDS